MGIRVLRDNLTATIRRVRAGETIEITHHGEPVATLVPARADRIQRLLDAEDIAIGRPLEQPLKRYPAVSGVSASQALEEDRAER
jgi:prevent-host-death family protein